MLASFTSSQFESHSRTNWNQKEIPSKSDMLQRLPCTSTVAELEPVMQLLD